jgi:hypothetical protein
MWMHSHIASPKLGTALDHGWKFHGTALAPVYYEGQQPQNSWMVSCVRATTEAAVKVRSASATRTICHASNCALVTQMKSVLILIHINCR